MKILFLCKANVARSQMAECIFNKLSKKHIARSAGIDPMEWEGKNLGQTIYVSPLLKEIGINADKKISKKVTLELVKWADKVIILGVDRKIWQDYLKNSDKIEYWDVKDPRHGDINDHRRVRDEVSKKVNLLVEYLK